MKTILTLWCFFSFSFFVFAQNKEKVTTINCREVLKKREYKKALKRGTILHITCEDFSHFFFLIEEETDTVGVFLNKNYKVSGKGLRITSAGPKFFVVKKKSSPSKYQYNFETSSWSFDEMVPTNWSTGNREDP